MNGEVQLTKAELFKISTSSLSGSLVRVAQRLLVSREKFSLAFGIALTLAGPFLREVSHPETGVTQIRQEQSSSFRKLRCNVRNIFRARSLPGFGYDPLRDFFPWHGFGFGDDWKRYRAISMWIWLSKTWLIGWAESELPLKTVGQELCAG